MEFDLKDSEYIELIKLLKATNMAETGAQAKQMVEEGQVQVNGQPELRKRAKLRRGSIVQVFDTTIAVT
ncbi:MAG TPA: RNA-binding S4 domain-containing protein [Bacteroidales bacterium]|nr:RNA-binding S4 domain-containing protein [Bacteroidales bacterium]